MNIVEIWFGILTYQAIQRGSFGGVGHQPMESRNSTLCLDKNGGTNTGKGYQMIKPIYRTRH